MDPTNICVKPYWNSNEERLLCMMLLDDGIAPRLSVRAGPAFWRCFIVQNRKTGIIYAKYRFRYKDPEEDRWYHIVPATQDANTLQGTREKIEATYRLAVSIAGEAPENAIQCFYPPDDGGDHMKTIIWLEQQDLIEIKVEPLKDSNGNS
jgi:hypothetical protein